MPKNDAGISVVVPCFNRAYCLGKAIESALAQHTTPREVIIVDDGSTDGSAAVAGNYGEQVRVIRTTNRGPAAARNIGLQQAQGMWVAFLDSDDVWHPEKLTLQLEALDAYPDAEVIFCDTQTFSNGAVVMPSRFELTNVKKFVADRKGEFVSF